MNGVHDMGGLQCFGPVDPVPDEPVFHAEWEAKVLALTLAMGATGMWNIDQARHTRESLPPAYYLSAGYYRIWLVALEQLLLQNSLVSQAELEAGHAIDPPVPIKFLLKAANVATALAAGTPYIRAEASPAIFAVGDKIIVKNQHTRTHTRLPGYIRGRSGVIHSVQGAHVFPDTSATGQGESPQWLYNVEFAGRELWGEASQLASVHVDCWEPYLESVT